MARIDLPQQSDLPDEYQYLLGDDALGELELLQGIGANPRVLQTYMRHGTALWEHAGLASRDVELVILAVARELRSEYEWHQHVGLARDVGVEPDEIRAIAADCREAFAPADRALIDYARRAARRAVDEDTHDALAEHVGEETAAGVATLVGHYVGTAVVIDALALRPETEFVGWEPDDETIETYDDA
ncbi:carboxymuconolactone decarboxylase family protein [Natronolimnohabitans innermongolicus]|uniref:Carboxymuconolactone decarboxylase n=1 Tax=Natronolimnohabitans innermongolicus JCM 12255 TaxID=1227499 RepID=L9WLX8_9EURY|nr:carboxymuconolactone decarboxylase family protein [Natronolimnohabitans innermongolicus]ELY50470.1 Carboxymuconolactone decarboxylase [Natronolimnohabitans innermongolicus JCM 12255]